MAWPEHIRKLLDLISSLRKQHTPLLGKFARKAGVDQTHYGMVETMATDIMMSTFLKICHALGIKIFLDTPWGFFTVLNPDTMEPVQEPLTKPEKPEKKKKKRRKEQTEDFGGYQ